MKPVQRSRGFSLIELILSLCLLGVVLSVLCFAGYRYLDNWERMEQRDGLESIAYRALDAASESLAGGHLLEGEALMQALGMDADYAAELHLKAIALAQVGGSASRAELAQVGVLSLRVYSRSGSNAQAVCVSRWLMH